MLSIDGPPLRTFQGVSSRDSIAVNGPTKAGQHADFSGSRFDALVARGDPTWQICDEAPARSF
jgi:hypothetical protein